MANKPNLDVAIVGSEKPTGGHYYTKIGIGWITDRGGFNLKLFFPTGEPEFIVIINDDEFVTEGIKSQSEVPTHDVKVRRGKKEEKRGYTIVGSASYRGGKEFTVVLDFPVVVRDFYIPLRKEESANPGDSS